MAELATIARPYAEALFKATSGHAGDTQAWLETIASIARNPQLLQLADDPKVEDQQVFDVIRDVAEKDGAALPEAGSNFLRIVIDNGRLAAVPEIANQFRALNNERTGTSDAVVYSAFPIDDGALNDLSATLEKRFGRKLSLSVQERPELIGGVRIVVGDEVLDTSVKARLDQMKLALTT